MKQVERSQAFMERMARYWSPEEHESVISAVEHVETLKCCVCQNPVFDDDEIILDSLEWADALTPEKLKEAFTICTKCCDIAESVNHSFWHTAKYSDQPSIRITDYIGDGPLDYMNALHVHMDAYASEIADYLERPLDQVCEVIGGWIRAWQARKSG